MSLTLLTRLILYYPVSALVTLFANILQNPQDARARADIKLMDLVVNFLSMLVSDESNGSVKRMLSVCAEFKRIAKVVLDKAEKESQSRRKRKIVPENAGTANPAEHIPGASKTPVAAPRQPDIPSTTAPFSPSFAGTANGNPFHPTTNGITSPTSPSDPVTTTMPELSTENLQDMAEFAQGFPDMLSPSSLSQSGFPDPTYSTSGAAAAGLSFQQPFVPQDLWQMPMTLEWDWADMSSSNPQTFDQGDLFGGLMRNDP
jgi:hypothetical protein